MKLIAQDISKDTEDPYEKHKLCTLLNGASMVRLMAWYTATTFLTTKLLHIHLEAIPYNASKETRERTNELLNDPVGQDDVTHLESDSAPRSTNEISSPVAEDISRTIEDMFEPHYDPLSEIDFITLETK